MKCSAFALINWIFLCHFIVSGSKEEELDSDDLDDDDDDHDDDDDDDDDEKEEVSLGTAEMNGTETLDSLRKYMDQMDQELLSTNIGQSFNLTVRWWLYLYRVQKYWHPF